MAPALSLPDVTRLPYDGYLGDGVDTAELLDQHALRPVERASTRRQP